jgi:hypothetical protein
MLKWEAPFPIGKPDRRRSEPTLRLRTIGFAYSTIQHNLLRGDILLGLDAAHGAGDTIRIVGNTIWGENIGFDANFVNGASSLIVQQNNITNIGGGVHLGGNVIAARILDNELEAGPYVSGSNGAVVDVDGFSPGGAESALETLISGKRWPRKLQACGCGCVPCFRDGRSLPGVERRGVSDLRDRLRCGFMPWRRRVLCVVRSRVEHVLLG